jgi:hypothetical protein
VIHSGIEPSSKSALFPERDAQRDDFRIVDRQHHDCGPANRRQTLQFGTRPKKVFRPIVAARMKQGNYLAAIRVKAGNIRSFEAIAMHAGKGKIRLVRRAVMLAGNDVIDLKRGGVQCSG